MLAEYIAIDNALAQVATASPCYSDRQEETAINIMGRGACPSRYYHVASQEPSARCLELTLVGGFFSNLNGDVYDGTSYVSLSFADGSYSSVSDDSS